MTRPIPQLILDAFRHLQIKAKVKPPQLTDGSADYEMLPSGGERNEE